MLRVLLLSLLVLSTAGGARAQETAKRGEVMLLGTNHLANNNRDLVNLPVEDVLAENRQQEIARLVESLARWRPTRIAVEWPRTDQAGLDRRYADYLAGRLEATANERDQIALRLAKRLGLERVEAIDWNEAPPGDPAAYDFMAWASDHAQSHRLETLVKQGQDEANRTAERMRGQTVSQWYRALNEPGAVSEMHKAYFDIASFGSNENNPGAAWVGAWYARNLRIFNNLRDVLGPDERVFVLYGVGHATCWSAF